MGIDVHGLHLLRWASSKSNGLGVVATTGRQAVNVPPVDLKRKVALPQGYQYSQYCEELLIGALGAERVDSFDYSNFEGATYIVDMNKPIDPPAQYDSVIDMGTLEHIFNVPQALRNLSSLCAVGGQIIHCLPANNYCGHGFWQFSPELLFSLYSPENGYAETQVFIADIDDETVWYEVLPPRDGHRATIWSDTSLYVLCRTIKKDDCCRANVQQSDYVFAWTKTDDQKIPDECSMPAGKVRSWLKQSKFIRSAKAIRFAYLFFAVALGLKRGSLTGRNPSLVRRRISEMV